MSAFEYTVEIARPPAEVFAYVTDPERFPEWQRDVVSVRRLDGNRFATTRRIAGAERTAIQEVTRDDPPHGWAVRGIDGPVRAHADVSIESINGGAGSRVTFTLDVEGHGVGVPLIPLVRQQAERGAPVSYNNLKARLEGPAGP